MEEQVIGVSALSTDLCGKVVVRHMAPADGRMQVRYLIRDQAVTWELTYIVRQADIERWRPLLEEMKGPLVAVARESRHRSLS